MISSLKDNLKIGPLSLFYAMKYHIYVKISQQAEGASFTVKFL